MMTEFGVYLRTLFTTPLETIWETLVTQAPLAAGAVLVLVAGWLFAALVRRIARHLLRSVGVDVILTRIGLAEARTDGKAPWRPSRLLAQLLYWVIVFVAVMTAFDMLGLAAASNLLQRVVAWIPRLLIALALLVLGLYITNVLADAAERIAGSARLPGARRIGLAVRLGLLALVGLTILQELSINVAGLMQVLMLAIAALALAAGLALGLGGRELGANLMAGQSLRAVLNTGQGVVWEGQTATVARIAATHTELSAGERRLIVPNQLLAARQVELDGQQAG